MARNDVGPGEIEAEDIRTVLEHHPIRLGVLFGSRARGRSGVHSDVDVAVSFVPSLSEAERHRTRIDLIVELTRTLGIDDVDVVDLDGVRPEVGASALEGGLVLVGDPTLAEDLRERFEARATSLSHAERMRRFDELLARMEEKTYR